MNSLKNIKLAFHASIPALFGYVSLGISFGLLFEKMGASWYLAPLMSLLVYAGAAQFVAVSLLINNSSLLQILMATFIINLRHIFYGISFLGMFPKKFWIKFYMIFGLTDETYSILTSMKENPGNDFILYLMIFCHAYWVIGSLIGALLGTSLSFNFKFLEFSLTILFVILTIEQAYMVKKFYPFFIACISSLLGLLFCPNQMMIIAMTLSVIFFTIFYFSKLTWDSRHVNK